MKSFLVFVAVMFPFAIAFQMLLPSASSLARVAAWLVVVSGYVIAEAVSGIDREQQ